LTPTVMDLKSRHISCRFWYCNRQVLALSVWSRSFRFIPAISIPGQNIGIVIFQFQTLPIVNWR